MAVVTIAGLSVRGGGGGDANLLGGVRRSSSTVSEISSSSNRGVCRLTDERLPLPQQSRLTNLGRTNSSN